MRLPLMTIVALTLYGCGVTKDTGESKSELVTKENGETVRSMVLQLNDPTLDGIQLGASTGITAQGLDDAGAPVAFADGKTTVDVKVEPAAYWQIRTDNYYLDLFRYELLKFELPAGATKWKIDLSGIPYRVCAPEPAEGTIAEVPDVTELDDKTGSFFTIYGKCKVNYTVSGSIKGLKGDLTIATSKTSTKTISGTGADVAFEMAVDELTQKSLGAMSAEEAEAFKAKVTFTGNYNNGTEVKTASGNVTVATAPESQTCAISNGQKDFEKIFVRGTNDQPASGKKFYVGGPIIVTEYLTLPTVNDIVITCTDKTDETAGDDDGGDTDGDGDGGEPAPTFSISGTVTGLASGQSFIIKDYLSGGPNLNQLTISANGPFSFNKEVGDGTQIDVRAATQPQRQYCVLTNDYQVVGSDVTNLDITCDTAYRIFGTGVATGDLGGVSGADATCDGSDDKPYAGTWKALIVDSSPARTACTTANCGGGAAENLSWVLAPNTKYFDVSVNNRVIGTTNAAGVFGFPLTGGFVSGTGFYYTGLNTDWTTSSDNCTNWTDDSGGSAAGGFPDATDSSSISGATALCVGGQPNSILCVEQP